MRRRRHWLLPSGIGVLAGALVLGASGFTAPGFAQTAQPAQTAQTAQPGPVGTHPATGTPQLLNPGPFEAIRVLKQCGNTVYVGGNFTKITQKGVRYTRDNVFSFEATAPYTITSWNPGINGDVQTMAFDGGNCGYAYIGGSFSKVGSTAAENIAEVSTTTGAVNTAWPHDANNNVDTMAVTGSHLLVGGSFTEINGSSADPYYTSLNIDSGQNDGYLDLHISGRYDYPGVDYNNTRIYNQQVSHAGARVMVEGTFTSVGGQARQQIFQMWLSSNGGVVTGWNAPVFNTHCATVHPFYTYDAAWAPSDNEVYVATTGWHIYNWNGKFPNPLPCDYAMAFSANEDTQSPAWSNSTGCNSLYSVIADNYAVYVGGHPRWSQNPDACKKIGPGAIPDRGLQGLNPATGKLLLNSHGTAMYYMSRANAYAMMLSSTGLWIGSTNRFGSNMCEGVYHLSGICYLPYPTS
jgi:hypothetical protein